MDNSARLRLLQSPWEPRVYTSGDLQRLLALTELEADCLVLSLNEEDRDNLWVTHHDLIVFLKDTLTMAAVPDSIDELSPQAQWLIRQGWTLDPMRNVFRWIDPEEPLMRLNLRGALKIELRRQNTEKSSKLIADMRTLEGLVTPS